MSYLKGQMLTLAKDMLQCLSCCSRKKMGNQDKNDGGTDVQGMNPLRRKGTSFCISNTDVSEIQEVVWVGDILQSNGSQDWVPRFLLQLPEIRASTAGDEASGSCSLRASGDLQVEHHCSRYYAIGIARQGTW